MQAQQVVIFPFASYLYGPLAKDAKYRILEYWDWREKGGPSNFRVSGFFTNNLLFSLGASKEEVSQWILPHVDFIKAPLFIIDTKNQQPVKAYDRTRKLSRTRRPEDTYPWIIRKDIDGSYFVTFIDRTLGEMPPIRHEEHCQFAWSAMAYALGATRKA